MRITGLNHQHEMNDMRQSFFIIMQYCFDPVNFFYYKILPA